LAKNKEIKKINPKEFLTDKNRIDLLLKTKLTKNYSKGVSINSIQDQLRNVMWNKCGIIRNRKLLLEAMKKITDLEKELPCISVGNNHNYNWQLTKYLETENLLKVAEIIVHSSLDRTESRGAHYREDYVNKNDKKWLKHIVIRRGKSKPVISYRKVNSSLQLTEGNKDEYK